MSKNIFCGSVRMVYAIIYTLFLVRDLVFVLHPAAQLGLTQGFGLTIGSDFYLVLDNRARHNYYRSIVPQNLNYTHGQFMITNASNASMTINGVLGVGHVGSNLPDHTVKSKAFTLHLVSGLFLFLVRLYSRSKLALVATTTTLVEFILPGSDILDLLFPLELAILEKSAIAYHGRLFLLCLCCQSCCSSCFTWENRHRLCCWCLRDRISWECLLSSGWWNGFYLYGHRGLIPRTRKCLWRSCSCRAYYQPIQSGIAQGGGVTQTYHSSAEQYSSGFSLALRMITVAAGVTIGLFVSQVIGESAKRQHLSSHLLRFIVYMFGTQKNAGHFAF